MNALLLVAVFALLSGVSAFPGGAPSDACNRIYPEGHAGSSQDLATSPYSLDISSLANGYSPGQTYALTLSGSQIYRGLLVQARTVADGSPVGSFQDISGDTRLSSCSPANSGITHSNRNTKTSTPLSWTAPGAGTGPITFLYAVVERNSGGVSTFWATAESNVISEFVEPLEVSFTGDTPVVTGNSVTAQISVSRPVPLQCQIVTRDTVSGEAVILMEEDCSSGEITFNNVTNGYHRLRVIAGTEEEAIRNRVIIMSDNPEFCSLNAINQGVTTEVSENGTAEATLEFRPIGKDVGFYCNLNKTSEYFSCSSPLTLLAVSPGNERVKIIPDPRFCRPPNRRSLTFKF